MTVSGLASTKRPETNMRSDFAAIAWASGLVGIASLTFWAVRKWQRERKLSNLGCFPGDPLEAVVEAHVDYLKIHFPKHYKKFSNLLNSDPEAARAEAAVFAFLKALGRHPEPADDPETGGIDFLCKPNGREPFGVEVTTLSEDSVSRHSQIPKDQFEGGGTFQMVTHALWAKVRDKAEQLSNYPHARILAVVSTHHAANSLFDATGAEWLLTSEPRITYPMDGLDQSFGETTDLASSVFFRPNTAREIVPCRQSVSAVLLVSLDDCQSRVLGILHPRPAYEFDIGNLPEVPFVRVREWPIIGAKVRTEWTISNPQAKGFFHILAR